MCVYNMAYNKVIFACLCYALLYFIVILLTAFGYYGYIEKCKYVTSHMWHILTFYLLNLLINFALGYYIKNWIVRDNYLVWVI